MTFDSQHAQALRERTMNELLDHLRAAREYNYEWYVWATKGQPTLTREQYEAVKAARRTRRKSA